MSETGYEDVQELCSQRLLYCGAVWRACAVYSRTTRSECNEWCAIPPKMRLVSIESVQRSLIVIRVYARARADRPFRVFRVV